MLTILSEDLGEISAAAYGVRSGKSKLKAATQGFCFANFVLCKKGGDIYRVESAEIIESFYPICEDFEKLSLGNYLLELSRDAMSDGDASVLALLLNTLYVITYKGADCELSKAVFELKLMQLSGYEPQLLGCNRCENESAEWFDFASGTVCKKCKTMGSIELLKGTLYAMRYILSASDKKIFSFEVAEDVREQLIKICEKYLLLKTDKTYKSLEYYKKIKRM